MAKAKSGDTVKVHYTGTMADGEQFDTSKGRDPLEFTIGGKQVIDGFDEAVVDKEVGETKTVDFSPEKGYGETREDMVMIVNKADLPSNVDPKVGDRYQVSGEGGQPAVVAVTALDEDTVTLDANHPLAGKTLTFEIELVEIA